MSNKINGIANYQTQIINLESDVLAKQDSDDTKQMIGSKSRTLDTIHSFFL